MKTKVASKREIYEWIRAHHTQALDDIQCWEIAQWQAQYVNGGQGHTCLYV